MSAIRISQHVAAPRAAVWRAWTDPDELAAWFWPPSWQATAEFDAQPGGRWRLASVTAGMAVGGDVAAVEPETRLVFTWRWEGEAEETLVTVTLQDADGGTGVEGTDVEIVHERFADEESRSGHEQGWRDCLARLGA